MLPLEPVQKAKVVVRCRLPDWLRGKSGAIGKRKLQTTLLIQPAAVESKVRQGLTTAPQTKQNSSCLKARAGWLIWRGVAVSLIIGRTPQFEAMDISGVVSFWRVLELAEVGPGAQLFDSLTL